MSKIAVRDFMFDGSIVRCVGTDRDLWFVAQDVCEVLGIVWKGRDSLSIISKEWIGVRKVRTPMMQRDGQSRIVTVEMIVINESAVYKLAFRSNKPKADAFTTWVAGEVMPSIRKTGFYSAKRATKYVAEGKSGEWIEKRVEGIETRKGFTDVLKDHAVEGGGYGQCTNAIYKPILGSGAAHQKIIRQLKPKANLRDSLSTSELIRVQFAESLAADRIEKERVAGNGPCEKVCGLSG